MKRYYLLTTLFSVLISALLLAETATASSLVTKVARDSYIYVQEDDHFRRADLLVEGSVVVPTNLLHRSEKGYVRISSTSGDIWLDEMDVTIEPPPGPAPVADCRSLPTSSSDSTMAATRGVGEGCK